MLPDLSPGLGANRAVTAPPRWAGTAACADADPELFFPLDEDGDTARAAKVLCAGCEVRAQCLTYALTNRMPGGVWGGLSTSQRDALLRARRGA